MEKIIKEKLLEIEQKEHVTIIMAIESGSRAWGFASPDSDYDVRFIYVRQKEDYLRLDAVRDVIEWQLDDTLDINGWDLKKALQLLHKSNPTVFEWCASPIVYRTSAEMEQLQELLPKYFSMKKGLFHYWHMAETHYRECLKTGQIKIKKYFYVLRSLLAAKWILDKQCQPPMLFAELMEAELEDSLKPEVERLLSLKQELPEMGFAPKVQVLNDYIEKMLPEIKRKAEEVEDRFVDWQDLNEFFCGCL
uniref:nucleotidyltransferase domain-containing protein n=1 Tax=Agathobacter sp. TaxID=2021311 RepID=UPI004056710C